MMDAPKDHQTPIERVYALSPEDTARTINLEDFFGSVTIMKRVSQNGFSHGEEIKTIVKDDKWTLSTKIPTDGQNRVLVLVRGSALTHKGEKQNFTP